LVEILPKSCGRQSKIIFLNFLTIVFPIWGNIFSPALRAAKQTSFHFFWKKLQERGGGFPPIPPGLERRGGGPGHPLTPSVRSRQNLPVTYQRPCPCPPGPRAALGHRRVRRGAGGLATRVFLLRTGAMQRCQNAVDWILLKSISNNP